jgi:hypothetical protein
MLKNARSNFMAKKKAPEPTFEEPKPPLELNTKSVVQIIHTYCDGRMSARPEFYSGRGVNTGDLNHKLLLMIYNGIKKELGDKPAEAFVEMVQVLKDMSATGFLNSLYRLEANHWQFDQKLFNQQHDGLAYKNVDEDGGLSAMITVMETLGRPKNRGGFSFEFLSFTISRPFLDAIGVEPKRKPKSPYFSY